MKRIAFLDRDGVINYDSRDYIKSPEEFRFIPKSIEAISLLNEGGWEVIVITNQSAIGRKMFSSQVLEDIHGKMIRNIKRGGGDILDIFFCPHLPDAGCSCRKPLPGMIKAAEKKYALDLGQTVMIGDRLKDIACGIHAGCGKTFRVETGKDDDRSSSLDVVPDKVFQNLFQTARWMLSHLK